MISPPTFILNVLKEKQVAKVLDIGSSNPPKHVIQRFDEQLNIATSYFIACESYHSYQKEEGDKPITVRLPGPCLAWDAFDHRT